MNEFLQRLKQRKLVQWAIAYVAAAFALLQGIDIISQQFGWPEGVRRCITLAMVVGFLVTRAYEQHDSGIPRLRYDPTLASLHDDPCFAAVVKKMGFAE